MLEQVHPQELLEQLIEIEIQPTLRQPLHDVRPDALVVSLYALLLPNFAYYFDCVVIFWASPRFDVLVLLHPSSHCGEGVGHQHAGEFPKATTDKCLFTKPSVCNSPSSTFIGSLPV